MKDEHAQNTSVNSYGVFITNHIDAMLAYWDKDQLCRFANNAYVHWFGKSGAEMIDKISMKELLGPLYEKNLPYIQGALAGKKQIFEREIPLPGGGSRHSLATYFPDIVEGEVKGFFVHVADVSYIKELEAKILKSRQEMLRSVIETQEKERQNIAAMIRDSVNQTLTYCKLMLQQKKEKSNDLAFDEELMKSVSQAIFELNSITVNLAPTSIEHFGFIPGTEDYIESFKSQYRIPVYFECKNQAIETIGIENKLSVFRIIQNFLAMLEKSPLLKFLHIAVAYEESWLMVKMSVNSDVLPFQKNSDEFKDIERRVEYYGGTMEEQETTEEKTLLLNLPLHR